MSLRLIALTAAALAIATSATAQSTPSAASAPKPPAANSAPYFTTASTSLGDLLDNPATKAVLQKHIPAVIADPQVNQARGMPLKTLQTFAPTTFTDALLAAIDADLAVIPAPAS